MRQGIQQNPLNEVYPTVQFDVSSFSMTVVSEQILKLVILLTLSILKLIFIFLTLGKLELTLLICFY